MAASVSLGPVYGWICPALGPCVLSRRSSANSEAFDYGILWRPPSSGRP